MTCAGRLADGCRRRSDPVKRDYFGAHTYSVLIDRRTGSCTRAGRNSSNSRWTERSDDVEYAAQLLKSLPASLVNAAHEPHGARAVVYALLLDRETEPRQMQLAHLSAAADPGVYEETLRLTRLIEPLDVRVRLPLLEIALPALGALTPPQSQRFKQNVRELVRADDRIDLFEWSLHRILLHELKTHHGRITPPRIRQHTLRPLQPQLEVLLSMLARAGHRDSEAARGGVRAGMAGSGVAAQATGRSARA